jgi:heptosyltransferase-2
LKALIIKTGYSETLDPQIGQTPSLGDVLRTTVILHTLKNYKVAWLADMASYPLLKDNPIIDRILIYSLDTCLQLMAESFDVLINLEKSPGLCALADKIDAWQKYGFRFDRQTGQAAPYKDSQQAFSTYQDYHAKRVATRHWQEVLYEMIDLKWNGEPYVLGFQPTSDCLKDIGFNHLTGPKWQNKSWPTNHWNTLGALLAEKETTWQEGEEDLTDYMNWIHKSKVIVSNDSLGLHIALAMGKKVIGLFGPTSADEVCFYDRGEAVYPINNCACFPCFVPECSTGRGCMVDIEPKTIAEKVLLYV